MSNLEMKVDALMRLVTASDSETYDAALDHLIQLREQPKQDSQQVMSATENMIEDILIKLGMPTNILGFNYTVEAIRLAAADDQVAQDITGSLYPTVAKRYGTTPSRAERAIRHAIERAWSFCDLDTMFRFFGNAIDPGKGKPTNSQFITRIAKVLRRKMNE